MRADGVAINRIAVTLQEEGIPCPGKLRYLRGQTTDKRYTTSHWSAQVLKQILRNPTYLGHLVFGRMPTALYLGKPDYHYEPDESKWRVLENMHEPLVTQEVFERVKAMAAEGKAAWDKQESRTAEYRARNVPIFHDVLYCGDCGGRMMYHRYDFKPERLTGSYDCPAYRYKRCSRTHTIKQDDLKAIVWQTIQDQLLLCVDYERALERLNSGATTAKMEEYRSEIQSLTIRINNCRNKRERLYEDFTDGILSPEEYTMMKQKYDSEYQELSAKLVTIQRELIRLKKALSGENEWLTHIQSFSDRTEFSTDMIEALIEKILVYQDEDGKKRGEIRFKYAGDRALLDGAYKELEGSAE